MSDNEQQADESRAADDQTEASDVPAADAEAASSADASSADASSADDSGADDSGAEADDGPARASDDPREAATQPPGDDEDDEIDTDVGPSPVETLTAALEQSKKDVKVAREKMLRVAADFDNFRKRSVRDTAQAEQRAVRETVKELLAVFDNLERATVQVDESADTKSVIDGLRMVHKLFISALKKLDIERVASVGVPFDPTLHEGIQHVHSDEFSAGVIMSEMQPGYAMGDALLRPAMVVVSKGPEPTAEAQTGADDQAAATGEPPQKGDAADGEAAAEAPADDDDAAAQSNDDDDPEAKPHATGAPAGEDEPAAEDSSDSD